MVFCFYFFSALSYKKITIKGQEWTQIIIAKIQARDDESSVGGGQRWLSYILKVELITFGNLHPIDNRYR